MGNFKNIKDLADGNNVFQEEYISSGIKEFDKLGVRFQFGQIVLVGSRPTAGKTLFLVYLFYHLWKSNGFSQAFIANKDKEQEILYKLFATSDGLEINDIRENVIDTLGIDNSIYDNDCNFICHNNSNWEQLKEEIISLHQKKGTRLFFIDTIQDLSCIKKFNNRDQELGFIMSEIKKLAVKHELIFFLSSSINRSCEHRQRGKPQMSDIRESGAIEEISDTIMLLYRPEIYGILEDDEGNSTLNYAELRIPKNRLGATGKVKFTFNNKIPRFEAYKRESEFDYTGKFNQREWTKGVPERP